jgi:multidrug efflux system outer membrane protein
MKAAALVSVLAFLIGGCTVGPNYSRPTIPTPDDHRGALESPKAESLADIPWWELFKDPVLQELTRDALRNNYDLRTAAARVEEARAQIGVTRSSFYPQVSLNGGGSAEQVSRATDPPESLGANRTFQNWFATLGLTW